MSGENKIVNQENVSLIDEYEAIFDELRDPLFIVEVDSEGTFKFLKNNEAHQNLTGLSPEKIKGKIPHELFNKETADHIAIKLAECFKLKENIVFEVLFDLPEGSANYFVKLIPILNNNEVVKIAGLIRDDSESKQTREELKKSEEKFRLYTEKAPVGLMVVDSNGKYIDANPTMCEMTGYSMEEILQTDIYNAVPEEALPYVESIFEEEKEKGVSEGEMWALRKDGQKVWFYVNAAKIDEDMYLASHIDITERKEAEEELAKANEELREAVERKNEFFGILSHELRNPLAAITMALTQLNRYNPEQRQFQKAKEIINRQVSRLTRLIDDLLTVTRIARNQIILNKENLELNNLLSQTVEDYQAMFQEKNIDLNLQLAPNEIYVYGDPDRLSQVIGNLLHNASKFTEEGGYTKVSIENCNSRHKAIIRVEDNGKGITSDIRPLLFEPFTRGDLSSSDLGLGLALVKGVVELHQGSVDVYSEGEGKGSIFTINLPINVS